MLNNLISARNRSLLYLYFSTFLMAATLSCFCLTADTSVHNQKHQKDMVALTKSAEEGDAEAQCLLGASYFENDPEKAAYWIEKSALQGDTKAQFILGGFYLEGLGVEKNYEKARFWLDKAAENNSAPAQFLIGLTYYKGDVIEQDYKKALYWFEKASYQNEIGAQYHLGIMHFCGFGIPKNYIKAAEFFEKAALQGDAEAQFELGVMFQNGEGMKSDYAKGAQWIEKSAEQGKSEAQSCLGRIYQNGWGVEKNPQMSLFWLSKAACQEDKKAIQILKEVFSPFQEVYSINLPDDEKKNWKIGHHDRNSYEYIIESVPLNESINNWSQIFTVMFMSHETLNCNSKTAITAVQEVKRTAIIKYGNEFKLNTLYQTENEVVYESFTPADKKRQSEYEIVRLIRTPKGIHRLSFAKKNSPIDQKTKEKWLDCIREARLLNFPR